MKNGTLRYERLLCSLAVAVCFCAAFLVRCASINNNLTGGPKDTLPPVIINMEPGNFTTNYPLTGSNRKIYVEFDEFVQLKDQQKEFFTSPQMKKKPQLSIRGKGVVIQIRDTLLENQTYALNFGSALRDNNEGNPLYSMRYVFSTGGEIDSMVCSGYTADSYKADSVSKSYIWFFIADSLEHHKEYDSTLFKYKPAAIARAETNGIFIAQNLKPVNYRVYAIEDKNDNQLYDPATDQVGFLEGTYNPAELPDFAIWYDSVRHYVSAEPQLYFRMFTDKAFRRQVLSQSERPLQHKAMLYFGTANPKVTALEFDSIPRDKVIYDPQTVGRDTVALWFNMPSEQLPDTIRGRITYFKHDTINQLQEVTEDLKLSWRFIESKEQQREREKQERAKAKAEAAGEEYKAPEEKNPFTFKMSTSGEQNPEKPLAIDFDYPIVKFDSLAVRFTLESEEGQQPVAAHFRQDTANMRRWYLDAPWQQNSKYKLIIPQGAITDLAGYSNDSISGSYTTFDAEKYATVKIDLVPRDDGSAYIVQLLNGSGSLQQEKTGLRGGKVQFNYVPAGEIKLRVIEDRNDNGKWDTGNVVERREPERAEFYVDEQGTDTFATKTNWEFEIKMDMNTLFAPVTMQSLIELLDKREEQRVKKELEERAKNPERDQKNNTHNHGGNSSGGFGMGGAFNTSGMRGNMGLR